MDTVATTKMSSKARSSFLKGFGKRSASGRARSSWSSARATLSS